MLQMKVRLFGRGLLSTSLTMRDLNCNIKWFLPLQINSVL